MVGSSDSTWSATNTSAYALSDMKKLDSTLLTNLQSGTYGSNEIWGQDSEINGGLPYLKNNMP